MSRRGLLRASLLGSGVLAGCSTAPGGSSFEAAPPLVPIRARTDRIFDIAVCLRPFRPAGPRVDTERLGDTLVVHNYGHGGSGWSLSWGSSARAVRLAMQASPGEVAVIGCGVLGLTSAILAQRAGARVTIYAREQLPLDDVGAGHRRMDARFAHRARQCRRTGLRCRVGGDGAHGLQDAPRLSRPAGHAGGMDRPILGFRRQRAHSPQWRCERRPEPAACRRLRQLQPPHRRSRAEMAAGAGRRHAVQGGGGRAQRDHDLQHRRLRPHPAERLLHRRRPVPAGRVPGAGADRHPGQEGGHQLHRATARGRCGRTRRLPRYAARSRG